jgi:hypothetical protein
MREFNIASQSLKTTYDEYIAASTTVHKQILLKYRVNRENSDICANYKGVFKSFALRAFSTLRLQKIDIYKQIVDLITKIDADYLALTREIPSSLTFDPSVKDIDRLFRFYFRKIEAEVKKFMTAKRFDYDGSAANVYLCELTRILNEYKRIAQNLKRTPTEELLKWRDPTKPGGRLRRGGDRYSKNNVNSL